jgi:hypothetical protein
MALSQFQGPPIVPLPPVLVINLVFPFLQAPPTYSADIEYPLMGHSRHFGCVPVTSGPPRSTDICRPARQVRLVPGRGSCTAARTADHLVGGGQQRGGDFQAQAGGPDLHRQAGARHARPERPETDCEVMEPGGTGPPALRRGVVHGGARTAGDLRAFESDLMSHL